MFADAIVATMKCGVGMMSSGASTPSTGSPRFRPAPSVTDSISRSKSDVACVLTQPQQQVQFSDIILVGGTACSGSSSSQGWPAG